MKQVNNAKAAKQSKQRPYCVHLIENWGEVKRGEAEKTVILDYKDFLSGEMWKWTKNGKVSASKGDYLFSAPEEGRSASHMLRTAKMRCNGKKSSFFFFTTLSTTDTAIEGLLKCPTRGPRWKSLQRSTIWLQSNTKQLPLGAKLC